MHLAHRHSLIGGRFCVASWVMQSLCMNYFILHDCFTNKENGCKRVHQKHKIDKQPLSSQHVHLYYQGYQVLLKISFPMEKMNAVFISASRLLHSISVWVFYLEVKAYSAKLCNFLLLLGNQSTLSPYI